MKNTKLLFSLFLFLISYNADAYKEYDLELAKTNPDLVKNLPGADLSFADLKSINLANSTLDQADFSKSNSSYATFENARLCNANFASANLSFANFENSDLTNADLSSNQGYLSIIGREIKEPSKKLAANLKETFASIAVLAMQVFPKEEAYNLLDLLKKDFFATLNFLNKSVYGTANKILFPISLNLLDGNRICANFRTATADEANFSYTFLIGANFEDASLKYANFQGCVLSNANFKGANLTNANLENTHVEKTDFRNTTGLSEEQKEDLYNRGAIVD